MTRRYSELTYIASLQQLVIVVLVIVSACSSLIVNMAVIKDHF